MANILLTTRCNRSCPYCFAELEMARPSPETFISRENLVYIADLMEASGQKYVSLLGGEPTLHPQCVDIILYLLGRGFNVTVFTNGVLSPACLDEFRRRLTLFGPDRLSFFCNINDPIQTPATAAQERQIEGFLSVMGPWTSPSFNIYRLDFTLDFLFGHIERFGMKRYIRIGIAHPIPGRQTRFIRPDDIRGVVERLYSYRSLFDSLRVSPGLDCGFPLCKFTDEEIGWLNGFEWPPGFQCGPGPDIGPDLSVYHCLPLSGYKRRSLAEFGSIKEMKEYYLLVRNEIKAGAGVSGIFDQCGDCGHLKEGTCAGGGLCHVLNRQPLNSRRAG